MRIYLSGKITGDKNYRQKFEDCENALSEIFPEAEIINPTKLSDIMGNATWTEYMFVCLSILDSCDTIYLMNDWTDSKGARIEREYAKSHKKAVIDYLDLYTIFKFAKHLC